MKTVLHDIVWEIPRQLGGTSRPGYPERRVGRATVEAAMRQWKAAGIQSVLCLLDAQQLAYYTCEGIDLIAEYRKNGFFCKHIPVPDHLSPPIPADCLTRILDVYYLFPKPLLIHCSAGIDRTGYALRYIMSELE